MSDKAPQQARHEAIASAMGCAFVLIVLFLARVVLDMTWPYALMAMLISCCIMIILLHLSNRKKG